MGGGEQMNADHYVGGNKLISYDPLEKWAFVAQELAAKLKASNERVKQLREELAAANERTKRLEEAGNALYECLFSVAGENHPAKKSWRKAKEDKP
jgi:hypothetical protein